MLNLYNVTKQNYALFKNLKLLHFKSRKLLKLKNFRDVFMKNTISKKINNIKKYEIVSLNISKNNNTRK